MTRDGEPIAELRPLPRRPLPAGLLLQRWRRFRPSTRRSFRKTSTMVRLRRYDRFEGTNQQPPVYTCNPADFAGIDGLTVVPVPVPAAP